MSRLEVIAGRQHAIDLVETFSKMPSCLFEIDARTTLLTNLRNSLPGFPEDYRKGIEEVIKEVEKWN